MISAYAGWGRPNSDFLSLWRGALDGVPILTKSSTTMKTKAARMRRGTGHGYWTIMGLLGLALAGTARAAEPPRTGSVMLTLESGVVPAEANARETRDMELELTLRDGTFEPQVWGYAMTFNRADHEGRIVSDDGGTLTVRLTLNRDKWFPKTPGEAEYRIALQREGDTYTGSYTGTFAYPGAEGEIKRDVKGKVTGKVSPLWSGPAPGFKKMEPNEHPRLIFRKSDLPLLKKRLETPEGKAIMARFLAVLPQQRAPKGNKSEAYFPAGYGLAYQLTGDKAHAEKAKELLADLLGLSGSQDIHYGPEAQSIAVTLDLCYDAWDPEFRQKVIDNLARRTLNLFKGEAIGTFAPNPWHNHNGVRAPSAGVAAICLLGEKTGDGKEIPGLERMIHILARDTRRYFEFNGTSASGWCLEGHGYKRMTWNSGPGHMIHAYRTAFGGDLLAGGLGAGVIVGDWMEQPPDDAAGIAQDHGDHQYSGLWPVGLVTVPESMKGGARWLYDRDFGLNGNKTFGLLWAYHAGYVLMNYPFDVPSQPPSMGLPWMLPDPAAGHWIFRKPWQGANDTLAVLQLRSGIRGGCHYEKSGRTWDMQLFALGRQWIGDRRLVETDQSPGVALPTASNPGAFNAELGPIVTHWDATPDGKVTLALDMSPVYLKARQKGGAQAPDQKTVAFARFGEFTDTGIRANRYVALDLSGASGVPVLMAVLDRSSGARDFTWNLKLAKEAGIGKVEGNSVIVGDPAGANLKCTFLAPKTPTLTGGIKASGGEDYYAVITIQNGAAPAVTAGGEGLGAKVTVGKQTLRFDGARIVFP